MLAWGKISSETKHFERLCAPFAQNWAVLFSSRLWGCFYLGGFELDVCCCCICLWWNTRASWLDLKFMNRLLILRPIMHLQRGEHLIHENQNHDTSHTTFSKTEKETMYVCEHFKCYTLVLIQVMICDAAHHHCGLFQSAVKRYKWHLLSNIDFTAGTMYKHTQSKEQTRCL